ncbi:MAG: amidohydrolase [Spirochaetaceae bacterium]|jgi:amidohydrolase|nr:amidohydrolase [Spirochaetaceae bacterium]
MQTDSLQARLIGIFQHLHRHPELSGEERETTAHIRSILSAADIEILDSDLATGLVARIKGKGGAPPGSEASRDPLVGQQKIPLVGGGKKVALRADIDALKISEESGLGYTSENPGVMHACGHDFHTTALIGAALELQERRAEFAGEVLCIFQPSEETVGGALSVLNTGLLDEVDEIYGQHCAPNYPSGAVAVCAGGTFAASIEFKIRIEGRGGHAALPQNALDPIVAAAALITLAQSIVSRNTDPFDQIVLGFSHIQAGSTWNVIPDDAFLEGTIRALAEEKAAGTVARLAEICKGIEITHGVSIAFDWQFDALPTNNDPALTEFVAATATKLGLPVVRYTPTMMGEDFGYYQKQISGVFYNFGVGCPQGLHSPKFIANTEYLAASARLLAEIAVGALGV